LVREISVLMPADAAQAKLAAQIVVFRETADDTLDRANAPGLTVEQVCRVRRAAADLTRTSATLERALSRRQQMPAAFFGTVLGDQVDIAALDAVWCNARRADRPRAPVGAAATPETAAPEPAASEPAAPGTRTPELAAEIAPASLEPAALRPGSESAPEATPVSDPTVRTMKAMPGGSSAAMHDGRMEARAA
jgi:hypothetical protein